MTASLKRNFTIPCGRHPRVYTIGMSLVAKHSMKSHHQKLSPRRPEITLPAVIGEAQSPIIDEFDLYCQIANSPASLGKPSPAHSPSSPFEKVDSWIDSLPSPPSTGQAKSHFLFAEDCLINKSRSKSFKLQRDPDTVSPLPDEVSRPRASSMSSRRQHHGSVKERRTVPSELEPLEPREQLVRVRSFRRTKHGLVNQGDSVRARSNCSLNSSQTNSTDQDTTLGPSPQQNLPQVVVPSEEPEVEEEEPILGASVHHHLPSSGPFLHQTATCQSFRIQVLGAPSVGKTTLCRQFMSSKNQVLDNTEDEEAAASDETEKFVTVLLDGEEYHMTFLDTERADEPQAISVLDVDAYMVVFAVDSRRSFHFAKQIFSELVGEAKRSAALLFVANKSDLVRNREVTREEAKNLAGVYQAKFIEVSTAFNHRVDELLISILGEIKAQHRRVQKERNKLISQERGGRGFRSSLRIKSPRQVLGSFIKKHFTSKSCEDLGGA